MEEASSTLSSIPAKSNEDHSNDKYGYEDAAPSKPTSSRLRGLGPPDAYGESGKYHQHSRQFRRSSLVGNSNWEASRARRRSTIHFGTTPDEYEVRLPGTSVPVTRRRSIGFEDNAEEIVVQPPPPKPQEEESPPDGPNDDGGQKWLKQEDYDIIAKTNEKIIRYVEKNVGPIDEIDDSIADVPTSPETKKKKNLCTRGLEGMMSTSSQSEDRQHAWELVLDEQSSQRSEGIFDEDRMAQKYHLAVIQNTLQASDRANMDEAEIQTYLKETRRMLRRMSV